MAAAKSKIKPNSQWSWRLAGVVLCAFFYLGVLTGLSNSGRDIQLRIVRATQRLFAPLRDSIARFQSLFSATSDRPAAERTFAAVATVERRDSFYALSLDGQLRGPISPSAAPDLPVLSGPAVEKASGSQLVPLARIALGAEVQLSALVSELRPNGDGTISLFLERPRMHLLLDRNGDEDDLRHASEVMRLWRGREAMVAVLDMTTPGQAVVRLREAFASIPLGRRDRGLARAGLRDATLRPIASAGGDGK